MVPPAPGQPYRNWAEAAEFHSGLGLFISNRTDTMEAEERPLKVRKINQIPGGHGSVVGIPEVRGIDHHSKSMEPSRQAEGAFLGEDVPSASDHEEDEDLVRPEDDTVNHGSTSNPQAQDASAGPPMSKNQLKKLRRKQEWEAGRDFRKAKRKVKIQEKKKRKREAREEEATAESPTAPEGGLVNGGDGIKEAPQRQHFRSIQLPITFVFDCGFDDLMLDKERISLAAQLTRCYSDNYRAPFKAHLAVSSFNGHLKARFDNVLSGHHHAWKGFRFLEEDFVEAAEQAKEWMVGTHGGKLAGAFAVKDGSSTEGNPAEAGEVVYLSSDSPDTLTELKPYSTYIIGGLVDRNRHKGICYKRAMDRGMRTARLPIGEYMEMTSRFVLATNHVSEIMLKWLELGDWGEAFLKVVPKRKGGVLKGDSPTQADDVPEDGLGADYAAASETGAVLESSV